MVDDGHRRRGRGVAGRVRRASDRFGPAREEFERWARARMAGPADTSEPTPLAETGPPDAAVGIRAAAAVLASSVAMHRLTRSPVVRSSRAGGDVVAEGQRLAAAGGRVLRAVAGLARDRQAADLTGAVLAALDAAERLRARLVLVASPPMPDHLGGLAPDAAFPSFRATAGNRGRAIPSAVRPDPSGGATGGGAGPWSVELGGLIWPTAVIDGAGDLYTGHADSEFVALHPDGSVKWRLHDDQMMYIDSTGALGRDGWLYLASTDVDPRGHQNQGRIWKVNPATGEVAWTFWGTGFEDPETDPEAHKSSFFEGHVALGWEQGRVVVYAGSDDNLLYKLDDTGRVLWTYDTDASPSGVIWTKPLLLPDGRTLVIGDLSGQVHAVRANDGSRLWARRLGGAVVSSPALGYGGEIVVGCFDGRIVCLAAEDGTDRWTYQTLGLVYSSAAVDVDGDVVIGSNDGGVYRLDRFGRRRWTYWTAGPVKSSPALDTRGNAYVGCESGTLYCVDREGRRRWSIDTDPGAEANPVNSSPSLALDATVYVGTSTGRVVAVPPGWCEQHEDDPAVSLDPGHDGDRPDVPPGGATLVPVDRRGTAVLGEPDELALTDLPHLALIAVDDAGDVVDARLVADGLSVEVDPPLDIEARVESMGRFIYLLPADLMLPATSYRFTVAASYRVGDDLRRVERTVTRTTEADDGGGAFPLRAADGEGVGQAVVLHEARVASPKELDALAQAMVDSQHFVLVPLAVDEAHHRFVAAVCWVQDTGAGFAYRPATTNKAVFSGRYQGGWFRLDGALRLVAQGINIPFDRITFQGRFRPAPGAEKVTASLVADVDGVGEFADLIRVMSLADADDDVVGFVSFAASSFDSPALHPPPDLRSAVSWSGDEVVVEVDGGEGPAQAAGDDDHWVHLTFWNPADGRVVAGDVRRRLTDDGVLELRAPVPSDVEQSAWRVVVGWDLAAVAVE